MGRINDFLNSENALIAVAKIFALCYILPLALFYCGLVLSVWLL